MKILLIAGHGAGDVGATSTINGTSYREADETRKVVADLGAALADVADVSVYPSARNAYADYQSSRLQAKFADYDYVLEVHFNAFKAAPKDGKTKGVECYVTTTETGTAVETGICKNIAALGLTNRGVKRYDFAVIRAAKRAGTSSALLEVCFLDDPDDMAIYTKSRTKVVQAIANGIVEGFKLQTPAQAARKKVQEVTGFAQGTMEYLDAYKYADALYVNLADKMR